jgi:hypothetical protein
MREAFFPVVCSLFHRQPHNSPLFKSGSAHDPRSHPGDCLELGADNRGLRDLDTTPSWHCKRRNRPIAAASFPSKHLRLMSPQGTYPSSHPHLDRHNYHSAHTPFDRLYTVLASFQG